MSGLVRLLLCSSFLLLVAVHTVHGNKKKITTVSGCICKAHSFEDSKLIGSGCVGDGWCDVEPDCDAAQEKTAGYDGFDACELNDKDDETQCDEQPEDATGQPLQYTVLAKSRVRAEKETDSTPVGALEAGEKITALEKITLGTGQVRIRFERQSPPLAGWISETSKSGKQLIVPSKLPQGEVNKEKGPPSCLADFRRSTESLDKCFERLLQFASDLKTNHSTAMTTNPTVTNRSNSLLHSSLAVLQSVERDLQATYGPHNRPSAAQYKFSLHVVKAFADLYDVMDEPAGTVRYTEILTKNNYCKITSTSGATLEYEYCTGQLYTRLVHLNRHALKRPDLAHQWYQKALELRDDSGTQVHQWTTEWQFPWFFMPGLQSQPWWTGDSTQRTLPIAAWMEQHYAIFKAELLALLDHPEYNRAFTQDDHALIQAGTWGELKIFNGKAWHPACASELAKTCELLSQRSEVMGTFDAAKTHDVSFPNEMVRPHPTREQSRQRCVSSHVAYGYCT